MKNDVCTTIILLHNQGVWWHHLKKCSIVDISNVAPFVYYYILNTMNYLFNVLINFIKIQIHAMVWEDFYSFYQRIVLIFSCQPHIPIAGILKMITFFQNIKLVSTQILTKNCLSISRPSSQQQVEQPFFKEFQSLHLQCRYFLRQSKTVVHLK